MLRIAIAFLVTRRLLAGVSCHGCCYLLVPQLDWEVGVVHGAVPRVSTFAVMKLLASAPVVAGSVPEIRALRSETLCEVRGGSEQLFELHCCKHMLGFSLLLKRAQLQHKPVLPHLSAEILQSFPLN